LALFQDSVFKPVYRRFNVSGADRSWTKDYLQSSGDQQQIINKILGTPTAFVPIDVEYRWPGGSSDGTWRVASDERGNLKWGTSDAPPPWRLGDVGSSEVATVPGDPNKTSITDADAEFATLLAKNVDPWIVAIKLRDKEQVLHVRAYLGNPPNGREGRGLNTLPTMLRDAIVELPSGTAGGAIEFPPLANVRAPALVGRILDALQDEPNVLLMGPPGTGKTVALEDIRQIFEKGGSDVLFDSETWDNSWSSFTLPPATARMNQSLVFHPSYAYEDFVAGLIPQSNAAGGLKLIARPGPLLSLAHWASDSGRQALLIIDEFNRGPAAAIFGDTIALLDAQKRFDPADPSSGAKIQRPFPNDTMEVEESFARAGDNRKPSKDFKLPKDLWIVAALNSTDRSVAPLDAALRRRFAILQVPPDYIALAKHLGIALPQPNDQFSPSTEEPANWIVDDVRHLAFFILRALNQRIAVVLGQDFLLGHALLWTVEGQSKDALAVSLGRAFDHYISASLKLTFVDQDEPLALILKVGSPADEPKPDSGLWIAQWNYPPTELLEVAVPHLELREIGDLPANEILQLLRGLL
jgi:5-methylcytosine-specific restriction protein B